MKHNIEVGYQAYVLEGGEEFGAVRDVSKDGRELTVYVENAGDFVVPREAVRSVHDGKVVFDPTKLEDKLIKAIQHAHDAEDPNF
jgi:hypothetical protein